jgi:hypothetical protein
MRTALTPTRLWLLLAALFALALGIAFRGSHGGRSTRAVAARGRPQTTPAPAPRPPAPIPGYLLIADRGNNRMLLVDGAKRVLWRYPTGTGPAMPFRFDDDTFFGPRFDRIISNQEDQDTIQVISFPGRRVLWRYGHVDVKGRSPGYLNTPDDAYLLPNGIRTVADAYNCRVLFISPGHRIVRQYGTTGVCRHDPPRTFGAVNGATPLADGGTLVSEIAGSWVDDIGPNGRLRWAVQAPVSYPSDPQLLTPNRILVADYAKPGKAIIMTRAGRVVWEYGPPSGPGALDHPSLATRIAPGLIAINDDYRDRVVLVSLRTRRIVWQYGHTDRPGRGPDALHTPDGLDLLPTAEAQRLPELRKLFSARPAAATAAGPRSGGPSVSAAPFHLPAPVQREVGVATPNGILLAGGLDAGGSSTSGVFRMDPVTGRVVLLGSLPRPFHDAAGAFLAGRLFVFGGGASVSSAAVQEFDPATRRGRLVGALPRPLSDLVSAAIGHEVYLVGGYDGRAARAEVYRTSDGVHFQLAGRLPVGLRYPAVVAVGTTLVVAGGVASSGPSSAVYAFDTRSGRSMPIGHLPTAVGHAAAVSFDGSTVFVLGGQDAAGTTVPTVTRIDVRRRTITPVGAAVPVADGALVALGSRALLIGGARGGHAVADVRELR